MDLHAVVFQALRAAILTGVEHQPVEAKLSCQIQLPGKSGGRRRVQRMGKRSRLSIGQIGPWQAGLERGAGGDAFVEGQIRARERFVFRDLRGKLRSAAQALHPQPLPRKNPRRMLPRHRFIHSAAPGIRAIRPQHRRPDWSSPGNRGICSEDRSPVVS